MVNIEVKSGEPESGKAYRDIPCTCIYISLTGGKRAFRVLLLELET